MCAVIFSTTFVWHIFHSKKKSARYHTITYVFMYCTPCPSQILNKLEFSWQIFKKSSNIKFHENQSSGSRAVPCRWTDRHTKANSHFS
jgi:hypothetical protein